MGGDERWNDARDRCGEASREACVLSGLEDAWLGKQEKRREEWVQERLEETLLRLDEVGLGEAMENVEGVQMSMGLLSEWGEVS